MPTDTILDVRTEIPRRRHELIFESFGKLAPGDSYVLVNDHDPKPLRYQFEAENAGEFSWEYLEEGPEVWRVRIGRVGPAPVKPVVVGDWHELVHFGGAGPDVHVLQETHDLKVVLVGLDAGQQLPDHPGPAASFHILDGAGSVVVDGEPIPVAGGATVTVPPLAVRAVRADTRMVFLGNLGDPSSEHGPH